MLVWKGNTLTGPIFIWRE